MAETLDGPKAPKSRGKKKDQAPAGQGHNAAPLTEDELAALQTYHELKIRAQQRIAAQAKSEYDLERDAVNGLFKVAGADLGMTRKEFEEVLAKRDMTEAEFLTSEAKRSRSFKRAGLPDVNGQFSLDLSAPADTASEQAAAYNDGFRAGRRADDPVPPKHVAPILHPEWMRGWHDGQAKNIMELGIAEEVIARRAAPATEETAEVEPEPEDEAEAIDDAARRLKAGGFLDTIEAAAA